MTVPANSGAAPVGDADVNVQGLPAAMGDAEVRELFAECGRIVSIKLERGAYSSGGASTKSARISFDVRASAEVAVRKLHGAKMRQACLTVELL